MERRNMSSILSLGIFMTMALMFLTVDMVLAQQERRITRVKERRVALVIGNSTYKSSPLKNPVNDANDMAAALATLGFDVIHKTDAGRKEMKEAIKDFGRRLRKGGVGLFYFAGHGIQVKGRNYLIPVNADIETESDVEYEGVDAGRVLGKMEDARNDLNIVILDACRDNPFARSFRSSSVGLAKMDAPKGSLVAYSTAPGSVAADGAGRNGVYTKYLLKFMDMKGLTVERVLKKVRIAVMHETGDKQVPWESSSLRGEFYFASNKKETMTPGPLEKPSSVKVSGKPPKPSGGLGDFDKLIRERKAAKGEWIRYQERMEADFERAEEFERNKLLNSKEKAGVWESFLVTYRANNPFEKRDDELRQKAREKQRYWGKKLVGVQEIKEGKLYVETDPKGANVKILNIKPRFSQGIKLKPGKYHLEVSAEEYETKRRWINLREGEDKKIQVMLARSRPELKEPKQAQKHQRASLDSKPSPAREIISPSVRFGTQDQLFHLGLWRLYYPSGTKDVYVWTEKGKYAISIVGDSIGWWAWKEGDKTYKIEPWGDKAKSGGFFYKKPWTRNFSKSSTVALGASFQLLSNKGKAYLANNVSPTVFKYTDQGLEILLKGDYSGGKIQLSKDSASVIFLTYKGKKVVIQ